MQPPTHNTLRKKASTELDCPARRDGDCGLLCAETREFCFGRRASVQLRRLCLSRWAHATASGVGDILDKMVFVVVDA